jgi:hypothetical protein
MPRPVGAPFLRPFDSSIILRAQGSGQAWREYGIFSKREYVRSLTFSFDFAQDRVRDDRRVCHFDHFDSLSAGSRRNLSFTKLSICCSYGDTQTSIGAPFLRSFDSLRTGLVR